MGNEGLAWWGQNVEVMPAFVVITLCVSSSSTNITETLCANQKSNNLEHASEVYRLHREIPPTVTGCSPVHLAQVNTSQERGDCTRV